MKTGKLNPGQGKVLAPELEQELEVLTPSSTATTKASVPVPFTNTKDRVGITNKASASGSLEAASRLHQGPELDEKSLRAEFPGHIAEPIIRAIKSVSGPGRREALLGLALLTSQEGPEKSLVALLMNRQRRSLSENDVSRFRATTRAPEAIAVALAEAYRSHESLNAGAYLPLNVRAEVQDALMQHPNGDEVKRAIEWIMRMTPRKNRGSYLLERLRQQGVVEIRAEGPKIVQPSQIVAAFSSAFLEGFRPTTGYVASPELKAEAKRRASELAKTGLTTTHHWHRSDPSGKRGLLAEHLRKLDIEKEFSGTNAQVVQGIVLMRVPPELRQAENLEQALAYCDAHNIDHEKVFCAHTPEGPLYGLRYTEIDLSVLEPREDGKLAFLRMENVKAGSGNAGHAREQNEKALDGLGHNQVVFLFPDGEHAYVDRTRDLVHDNRSEILLETVGPLGNEAYTKSYGLGSEMLDLVRDALSAR